uniref:Ionotropic glutamate receptor L-glutamate and glycine-binding domain-containing protein n=1 Tax=Octopus bimaculoides TaxID=37653 RepID=A0A0L8I6N7_OCTBM
MHNGSFSAVYLLLISSIQRQYEASKTVAPITSKIKFWIYGELKLGTKTGQWRHTRKPKNKHGGSFDQNEEKVVNAGINIFFEKRKDRRRSAPRTRSTWRSGPKTRDLRIMINRSVSSVPRYRGDIFGTKPLRVVTIIEPPFVQVRNSTDYLNDDPVKSRNSLQLEGFCIDILKAMSKILKFQFEIYLAPDGKFGSKKKRGWTGMIRELIDNKADVALAPFSVTPERSQVVDFTKSFMTKGTTVVVKKPQRTVWMFQFLFPLSNYVWIGIFLSFLVVSLALFGVSRVNSDKHRKYTHNFLESFWYIWGTLLRGSLKSSPLAVSSRIISSSWWLFSLIIISVYTANLAAFLTVTNIYLPIENAADLAYQTTYDYGTVNESQIEDFFKHTNISHYSKMWLHMRYNPESIVQRVEEGLARARNTKYAFIWDSPTLRWEIADKCDLMEIGNPFDLKGYGFAVRKDTAYTEALSSAILKLGDTGERQKSEGKYSVNELSDDYAVPLQIYMDRTRLLDMITVNCYIFRLEIDLQAFHTLHWRNALHRVDLSWIS